MTEINSNEDFIEVVFDDIISILSENGINSYHVEISPNMISDSIWFLSLEDFLKFVLSHEINEAFICEKFLDVEEYLITDETISNSNYMRTSVEYIADEIAEYNFMLLDEDFSTPEYIFVMIFWESQRFIYVVQNIIHLSGEPLPNPNEKLQELIACNSENIEKGKQTKQKVLDAELAALKREILSDPELKNKCSNSRLRRNYIYSYFGPDCQYTALKKHWTVNDGILLHGAFDFIESIWKEYKNK